MGYAQRHVVHLALASLAVLASAGLSVAVPVLIRQALDAVALAGDTSRLWPSAALIVAIGLAEGVSSFGSRYLMESVGFHVVYRLRAELFSHLNQLSFEFHDNARVGDIMARLTADTQALSRLFGFALPYIAANALTILAMAGMLMVWNLRLGIAFVLLIPLMVRAMWAFGFQVQPAFQRSQRQLGALTESLRVALLGMREAMLFGQERRQRAQIKDQGREYRDVNLAVARTSAFWMPYASFLVGLTTALALGVGGLEVLSGRATPGTLVAFLSYAGMLTRPIRQTGMLTAAVVRGTAAGSRVLEIVDHESPVRQSPQAYGLPESRGEITLEGVHFHYSPETPVLEGIQLTVEPGETVAIVGPTGAGKSTLVHLIPRFYDPTRGRVLVDGHDVRDVTLASLRRQVGTALQSVFVFNGSVRDNIAFGAPEAPLDRVMQVAKLAQLHSEIEQMPAGYDTALGERGVSLSGGQRQRLALARVLLTNPRILILDEISSELDSITELRLRTAIENAFRGRTTLVIAHRLWTIRKADRIVVLDRGRVAEQGTHDQLMALEGLYWELYLALTRSTGGGGTAR